MNIAFTGTSQEILIKLFLASNKYSTIAKLIEAVNRGEYKI